MRSLLSFSWVKNVYNQRIVHWETQGQLYTVFNSFLTKPTLSVDNTQSILSFIPVFTTPFSTSKSARSHLLNGQLYPFSTEPIIKKKKET